MATKPEGEQFVDAFIDARRFQFQREIAREALRRNALEANLFETATVDLHFEEKIEAIAAELEAFNTQRTAELSGLVDGRLITVRNVSPEGMSSAIVPVDINLDAHRRLQTITGSDVKIMDNVRGFTALSIHPILELPNSTEIIALTDSLDNKATNHFQVSDIAYRVLGSELLLPRVSIDIHDE